MGINPVEAVKVCEVAVKGACDGVVLDVEDSQTGVCGEVSAQIDTDEKPSENVAGWLPRGTQV